MPQGKTYPKDEVPPKAVGSTDGQAAELWPSRGAPTLDPASMATEAGRLAAEQDQQQQQAADEPGGLGEHGPTTAPGPRSGLAADHVDVAEAAAGVATDATFDWVNPATGEIVPLTLDDLAAAGRDVLHRRLAVELDQFFPDDTAEQYAAETLKGDLRDAMLERVKHLKKPWAQMTQSEQSDCVYGLESAAASILRNIIEIIAMDRREVIKASVKGATVKEDGIEVKLIMTRDEEGRHDMLDAVGAMAFMTVASVAPYWGQRQGADAHTKPDQPPLPLDGGSGTDAPPAPEPQPGDGDDAAREDGRLADDEAGEAVS